MTYQKSLHFRICCKNSENVLSILAAGYTRSIWHGGQSIFTLNQIKVISSGRAYSVT